MGTTLQKSVNFHKFTSGSWLIFLAIASTVIGLSIWAFRLSVDLSVTNALTILALISGFIYALTNVNDRRIIMETPRVITVDDKTEKWDEATSAFLKPEEFVLWGGLLGVLFSWITLPLVYIFLSVPITRIPQDLSQSLNLSLMGIPVFLIAGIATIISTYAYLNVVGERIDLMVFPVVTTTFVTVVLGAYYFKDPMVGMELAIPLLFLSFLAFFYSKGISLEWKDFKSEKWKKFKGISPTEEVQKPPPYWLSYFFATITVVFEVITSFAIRGGFALSTIEKSDIFLVAINLRTAYFSMFLVYALLYMAYIKYSKRARAKHPDLLRALSSWKDLRGILKENLKKIKVLIITPLTFVCTFALKTAAYGENLAMSPTLFSAIQTLAFPLLGAWYFTDASKIKFLDRFLQVLGKVRDNGHVRRMYGVFYFGSLTLCVIWAIYWYSTTTG